MTAHGLFFDEGYLFGQEGAGFERINLACPRRVLVQAMERLRGMPRLNASSVNSHFVHDSFKISSSLSFDGMVF